eukprot:Tbor_TRINITY_DN5534_c0_g1::TRINITY_DN5534_c0_g1_i1::g.12589::m.12589
MSAEVGARIYDFIVYGATGYTGQLVVEYLSKASHTSKYKWAIAGRNIDALNSLANKHGGVPVIQADVSPSSLKSMCEQATVLLSLVGPYTLYGMPVVDACVDAKTHYIDITGEYPFIRKSIDKYHELCEANNILLISCAGFDSVPGDIGNLLMHNAAKADGNVLSNVKALYQMRGNMSLSGGTSASGLAIHEQQTITPQDEITSSLNPPMYRGSEYGMPVPTSIEWEPVLNGYSHVFIMAGGNMRIVQRSNALLGYPKATYQEKALVGSYFSALGGTMFNGIANISFSYAPLRNIIKKVLPKQGTGPTAEAKVGSGYNITFLAEASDGTSYKGTFGHELNGYDSTAVMAAEITMLVVDKVADAIKYPSWRGGCLTPAVAVGAELIERLKEQNFIISTEKINKQSDMK